jgi:hypothetical protein
MTLSAYFGVPGLLDVGYRFYNANESPNGARITAAILDGGDGWYSVADPAVPAGAASVRWDSVANPTYLAREYFSSPSATAIADEVLKRDWLSVTGEANESVLNALRAIRNKWSLASDGTLTVFREDGASVAWTRNVQTDANAKPIVGAN